MVSHHSDTKTYSSFLSSVETKVLELANSIVERRISPVYTGFTIERIREEAQIVVEDGWIPAFFMIDGSNAERKAISKTFPGRPIRACQFHMMQAIKSKATDLYRGLPDKTNLVSDTLQFVRECQRCPLVTQFEQYFDRLIERVRNVASASLAEDFKTYLLSTWFSTSWRELCCDWGIRNGVSREGSWSTNNLVEAAFRVFDRVFLRCQANKR
jgi:hypothetical protein